MASTIKSLGESRQGTRQSLLTVLASPIVCWVLAFWVYSFFSVVHGQYLQASINSYYNYLADAFLHGQLHLRLMPPSTHDLTYYHGQYYLYWGPLPSIILMPFIAVFGVGLSDSLFTVILAATNVALIALLLRTVSRNGWIRLSDAQRVLLILCFAFGSVHLMLASMGNVWSTDQIFGVFWVIVAYNVAIATTGRRAFLLTGAALAGALLTRNHLVLTGVFPAAILIYNHRSWAVRRIVANLLLSALPIIAGVALLGAYDWARFGSVTDNGIAYHLMDKAFLYDFHHYGFFSLHYVPINLYYQYIFYPFPLRQLTLMGGSLFLLTPVFFAVFQGIVEGRPRWFAAALLASVVLTGVPILLLMGTGWKQFGPRYTLDFTVPLLLLTAIGIRRWPTWLLGLFTVAAIAQYVVGTLWFISL